MIRYLETFFKEKNLPNIEWEIVADDGVSHFISNVIVIEHIETAPVTEQEAIAVVIRKIDFHNGDVNDYLRHLAGALING